MLVSRHPFYPDILSGRENDSSLHNHEMILNQWHSVAVCTTRRSQFSPVQSMLHGTSVDGHTWSKSDWIPGVACCYSRWSRPSIQQIPTPPPTPFTVPSVPK